MRKLNVLSLFDGISAGQMALKKAEIEVDKYFASEIDKHAIKVTDKNFPNTVQLGDITNWSEWDIDWKSIDLVMGGSPCQGFSFAGKQLNFEDPRSKLFFVFLDICNHIADKNPKMIFLLENVKMKKEYQNVISEKLGIEPIEINSALVSAQNRKRLYWTNIPMDPLPDDKEIYIEDILETNFDSKYWLPEKNAGLLSKKVDITGAPNICCIDVYNKRYKKDRKSPTLTHPCHNSLRLLQDGKFRKLTPIECERLQTFPDNYTEGVSDTQRYKALGNSWTVDVIVHIFKKL